MTKRDIIAKVKEQTEELKTADASEYEIDEVDALEDLIVSLYSKISIWEEEKEHVSDPMQKLELDEKIANARLQIAKEYKQLDKMKFQ